MSDAGEYGRFAELRCALGLRLKGYRILAMRHRTRVGEIDTYLTDGVDIFFAPPDDAEAFAGRLRFVLSHPEAAAEVGRRGRAAAERHFSYRQNARSVSAFLRDLAARRGR